MRTIVLYDQDCGFCRWSSDKLVGFARRSDGLEAVPIQGSRGQRLLTALPAEQRLDSFHVVSASGELVSAGAALPIVLRQLPGGGMLAPIAEALPGLTERTYRLVARHRGRLGQLIGERACAVDPAKRLVR